jgi:tRNA threonylcarbamoyladenosine dehydratase
MNLDDAQIRFSRVILAIGQENFMKLQNATVAIIGIGAVGGFATEALARSGIGHLRIADIDIVQKTNINRQLLALESTMGKPKVDVAAERILQINPSIDITPIRQFVHTDTLPDILSGGIDYVVDAIDAILPKVELLAYCFRNGIPVISSMGAAFKTRYEGIRIADISESSICPLARTIRRRLRRRGISSGVTVIYSDEAGPPFIEPEEAASPETGTLTHRGRPRRILGSLCPLAGVFGLLAAHHVIWSLIESPETSLYKADLS